MKNCIKDFKNKHIDDECIVFGTGPSLNEYDNRFDDGRILIGTNEIVYYKKPMDYYFIGDAGNSHRGFNSDPRTYTAYRPNIAKFYRIPDPNGRLQPSKVPMDDPNVIYYCVIQKNGFRFFDNGPPPFTDALSITFEALQFCLMAGFKKIYLVGHDCDYTNGSFKSKDAGRSAKLHLFEILTSWEHFRLMIEQRFPEIEIVNVNPVKMRFFNIETT